jgi:hypothetical protein
MALVSLPSVQPHPSDAIKAAALAAALAENALESGRKERAVGSFEHTPQHLHDVDDPCFGFVESNQLVLLWWRRLGRLRPRQQLGSCCVAVLPSTGEWAFVLPQ